MFKLDFKKAEEPEIKLPTSICWITEKAREFQKNIYFCFIDYTKAFVCVDHNKLWKILKDMEMPDHLTCLLRNLYAGQEATVRTTWNNGLVPNWEKNMSRLSIGPSSVGQCLLKCCAQFLVRLFIFSFIALEITLITYNIIIWVITSLVSVK